MNSKYRTVKYKKNKLGKHIKDAETLQIAIESILKGENISLATEDYREKYSARSMSKRFAKLFEEIILER